MLAIRALFCAAAATLFAATQGLLDSSLDESKELDHINVQLTTK